MKESLVVKCGFCQQANRVLWTRLEDAKCGGCKAPLIEVIADTIVAATIEHRTADIGGFVRMAQKSAHILRRIGS